MPLAINQVGVVFKVGNPAGILQNSCFSSDFRHFLPGILSVSVFFQMENRTGGNVFWCRHFVILHFRHFENSHRVYNSYMDKLRNFLGFWSADFSNSQRILNLSDQNFRDLNSRIPVQIWGPGNRNPNIRIPNQGCVKRQLLGQSHCLLLCPSISYRGATTSGAIKGHDLMYFLNFL